MSSLLQPSIIQAIIPLSPTTLTLAISYYSYMGECSSVCRPICEEHRKAQGLQPYTRPQRRQIILKPNTLIKEKKSMNADLTGIAQTAENEKKPVLGTFFSHSTEESLAKQTKTEEISTPIIHKQDSNEQEPKASIEENIFLDEKPTSTTQKVQSALRKEQRSLNCSINASYLPQSNQISPKLVLPSQIHDSLLQRWHQSNYQPSRLFAIIDYDAIFDPK